MFIIVDNFYQDPDSVRELALSWDFNVVGNYPGIRTVSCGGEWLEHIKGVFERLIGKPITYFPGGYNTAFQYTTEHNKTWIHYDETEWAAVVYLTPDAPIDSGTAIYRHKPTGIYYHEDSNEHDFNEESSNEEDWEIVASAGNIYNRLVLYRGNYYHRSIRPGFGTDQYNGRLFQTFFFST